MIASYSSTVALIVDHDLGFVMWLGEVCAELGCQAMPALRSRQALAIARRTERPIATLFINPHLRGAQRAIQAVVAMNPGVRVVLILDRETEENDAKPAPFGISVRWALERPSPSEPISRPRWTARIRRILAPAPDRSIAQPTISSVVN